MFTGHLAVGFAAKRIEPKISLGTWMLAAMLADLLLFPLLIAGVERVTLQPGVTTNRVVGVNIAYSHSLLMDVLWGVLFALAYYLYQRYFRGAWLLFAAVLSHWVLDVVSHRPDMPIAPGVSTTIGLGLWNSIPATLAVEGGLWLIALILYVRFTPLVTRVRRIVFWIAVVFLTFAWYGNIKGGMDPNPVRAGVGGLIFFSLMVVWAYWIDHRRPAYSGLSGSGSDIAAASA